MAESSCPKSFQLFTNPDKKSNEKKLSQEDIDLLIKENEKMKKIDTCILCKDRGAKRLVLPCACLSVCNVCIPPLFKCAKCKASIRGIVSVHR